MLREQRESLSKALRSKRAQLSPVKILACWSLKEPVRSLRQAQKL